MYMKFIKLIFILVALSLILVCIAHAEILQPLSETSVSAFDLNVTKLKGSDSSSEDDEPDVIEPQHGQVLPYYEVYLRWEDSVGELYYTLAVRNLSTDTLICNNIVLPQDSTYYTIPISILTRGVEYRWCVMAHFADESVSFYSADHFSIEHGDGNIIDTHIFPNGFSSAENLEYYIDPSMPYVLKSKIPIAVDYWNYTSPNVYITQTTNEDSADIYFLPYTNGTIDDNYGGCARYLNGVLLSKNNYTSNWNKAVIMINKDEIDADFANGGDLLSFGGTAQEYYTACITHEIGHALSLDHTDGTGRYTYNSIENRRYGGINRLIMNSGCYKPICGITFTDKKHLLLKWGDS